MRCEEKTNSMVFKQKRNKQKIKKKKRIVEFLIEIRAVFCGCIFIPEFYFQTLHSVELIYHNWSNATTISLIKLGYKQNLGCD